MVLLPVKKDTAFKRMATRRVLAFGCALAMVVCCAACGKKTPPVVHRAAVIPAVTDLTATADGCAVTLRWSIPKGDVTGFAVLRAQNVLSADACSDCPKVFVDAGRIRVDTLSLVDRRSDQAQFSETVDCGFLYVYKVVGYAAAGDYGSDSNWVSIIVPQGNGNRE